MIQLEVEGVFLDLYDSEPPKLNFAIEDITTTQAQSVFSRTFRLPATANNNQFFKHAFLVNGIDFDITIKRTARINIDGVLFRTGELRLNKIYTTRENERIDYECIFLGETRSLATSIGEEALCDLDTSDLEHLYTYDNIIQSWGAYPSGTTTDGLLNGDVLYPLVDFGNTYDDNGLIEQTRIGVGSGVHFTQFDHPLEIERFKPMVRAKWVWDKIFDNAGFTYTSNFLTSDLFKQLYVSAWGNDDSVILENINTSNLFQAISNTGDNAYFLNIQQNQPQRLDIPFIDYDYGNNYVVENNNINYYLVPEDGDYRFGYDFEINISSFGPINTTFDFAIRLKKDTGGVISTLYTAVETNPAGFNTSLFSSANQAFSNTIHTLNAGDKIYLEYEILTNMSGSNLQAIVLIQSYFLSLLAPGQMNVSNYFDCDYKQIDFIKDIITKFRLVLAPDKLNPTNFIIEPWSDYIGSGDIFDWTEKLDVSKDFTIEPLFYTQKSKIEFRDKEDGDYLNELYFNQFNEPFGSLDVISNNELLKDTRKVETNFSPTPVKNIEGSSTGSQGMGNCIIPQVHTHETGDNGLQHTPIKPNTRFLFYNGTKSVGLDTPNINNYWILNPATSTKVSWEIYPMVSEYSDFPTNSSTTYLNWEREPGYIQYDLLDYQQGLSVYEKYWSSYINSLYNKWARKITAYFILDSSDLQDFSFDDVIFVKDTYYYVNKINDVSIGEKTSVKVELIKLINFNVPTDNIIPLGNIWNEVSDTWDGTSFTWND